MGKLLRLIVTISVISTIIACANSFIKPHHEMQRVIEPGIGEIVTVSLGEAIISSGTGYFTEVLIVHKEITHQRVVTYHIYPGVYEYIKTQKGKKVYLLIDAPMTQDVNGNMKPVENRHCLAYGSDGSLELILGMGRISLPYEEGTISFEEEYFVVNPDSFQQTMVYTGKQGNIIRFSYREFSDNRIRYPFTTDVQYDLSESHVIGYKAFKAEVIQATNSQITYKLISGF